ncbi:hypothetical protein CR513_16821, partial [Mucuna pruriens]
MVTLHSSDTWELGACLLPPDKTIVGYHWVFTVKIGSDVVSSCLIWPFTLCLDIVQNDPVSG